MLTINELKLALKCIDYSLQMLGAVADDQGLRTARTVFDAEISFLECEAETINFTRIKNDGNGNARYVCHYHSLLTRYEIDKPWGQWKYELAVKRANLLGGRKFNNKQYAGGIVFQSFDTDELSKSIKTFMAETEVNQS